MLRLFPKDHAIDAIDLRNVRAVDIVALNTEKYAETASQTIVDAFGYVSEEYGVEKASFF